MQEIQRKGGRVIGLVNVVGSTIARECDGGIYLHAGPGDLGRLDQGVHLDGRRRSRCSRCTSGRMRDLVAERRAADHRRAARRCPAKIAEILELDDEIAEIARDLAPQPSMLFIGRRRGFPVAREGAQKLKEISYLHAEAYPSAELKHGPLALISPELPTVAVVPDDDLFDKNISTLRRDQGPRAAR